MGDGHDGIWKLFAQIAPNEQCLEILLYEFLSIVNSINRSMASKKCCSSSETSSETSLRLSLA
jgi:hypothetical protein